MAHRIVLRYNHRVGFKKTFTYIGQMFFKSNLLFMYSATNMVKPTRASDQIDHVLGRTRDKLSYDLPVILEAKEILPLRKA